MKTAQIDVSADYPVLDFCQWCEKHNVQFQLVEANGPAGGNPVFEISGSAANVDAAVADHEG